MAREYHLIQHQDERRPRPHIQLNQHLKLGLAMRRHDHGPALDNTGCIDQHHSTGQKVLQWKQEHLKCASNVGRTDIGLDTAQKMDMAMTMFAPPTPRRPEMVKMA